MGGLADGAGLGLGSVVGAGANVAAPALCILGVGFLALGAWPRATAAVSYGLLAWSITVELLGGFLSSNHWLLDTSVFHQVRAAPAVGPDWTSVVGLVAVGAVAAVAGGLCFRRRDLVGE